jgi:PD-(D/E)XK nuclease superfamily protein
MADRVGVRPYDWRVQLTEPQRRTLERLIVAPDDAMFPSDLGSSLRERIEGALDGIQFAEPLWLGKEKLTDHARCDGKFLAQISGEGPPFQHNAKSAAGLVMHKAIEVEVGAREPLDPDAVVRRAVERLCEPDERFAEYWRDVHPAEQDEVVMEAVRRVTLFRASFPSLRELRGELGPVPELSARAELLDGTLVLSGRIDLVLGLPDRERPARATRLAIDLKTGGAYPEYPEDMRFYALLMTLRFGVPPFRAASLFLDSGEWQAEDVTVETLERAADRVAAAARAASELMGGRAPRLVPGPYCAWCPRASVCPVAQIPP